MPETRIRQVTADDQIWPMLKPAFRAGDTYTIPHDIDREAATDFWMNGHKVFVAEDETGLLGTYYICPNQRGGGAHVCNCGFITAEAARGKGVARSMLEHALGQAVSDGFRAMQFNFVVSTNSRAVAIWESYGFDVVGRLPSAFNHPDQGYVDALVMYKTLIP